jgi:hypothetical protein
LNPSLAKKRDIGSVRYWRRRMVPEARVQRSNRRGISARARLACTIARARDRVALAALSDYIVRAGLPGA